MFSRLRFSISQVLPRFWVSRGKKNPSYLVTFCTVLKHSLSMVSVLSMVKKEQLSDAGAGGADCIGWLGLHGKAWGTVASSWSALGKQVKSRPFLLSCRSPVLHVSWQHVPERPFHPLPLRCSLHRHPPRLGRLLWEQRLRIQLRQRRHNQRHRQDRLLHLPNQHLPRGPVAPLSLPKLLPE